MLKEMNFASGDIAHRLKRNKKPIQTFLSGKKIINITGHKQFIITLTEVSVSEVSLERSLKH